MASSPLCISSMVGERPVHNRACRQRTAPKAANTRAANRVGRITRITVPLQTGTYKERREVTYVVVSFLLGLGTLKPYRKDHVAKSIPTQSPLLVRKAKMMHQYNSFLLKPQAFNVTCLDKAV